MPLLSNPAARLLSLGILTLLLNKLSWPGLMLVCLPLVYLFYKHDEAGKQVLSFARRLRWFFTSIIILYFWFYPGVELIPSLGSFSPVIDGITEAGRRIASLLVILSYSVFFLTLTPRAEVISAIQFILTPLSYLGINSNRFAMRLGLVLATIPELTVDIPVQKDNGNKNKVSVVIDQLAEMVKHADTHAAVKNSFDDMTADIKTEGITDFIVPVLLFICLIVIS